MPQYQNTSSQDFNYQGLTLPAQQTIVTDRWVDTKGNPYIIIDTTVGNYDPIILSQVVTSLTTITIPAAITGSYCISIFSDVGLTSVKYNISTNTSINIPAGTLHECKCMSRVVNSIIVSPSAGGTAYVNIVKS